MPSDKDSVLDGVIKTLVKENTPLRSVRGQYFREAAKTIAEKFGVAQETLDWTVAQYITEYENQTPTSDLVEEAVFFAKLGCSHEMANELLKILTQMGGYRKYAEEIAEMMGRKLSTSEVYKIASSFIRYSSTFEKEDAVEMIRWASDYLYEYQITMLEHELEIRSSRWKIQGEYKVEQFS